MCGIAGLFDTTGSRAFEQRLVRAMTDAIAHRGPDGEGFYFERGVAFGHRRLAIIDPEGGHQPMQSPDRQITITYNGEIFNFREVRDDLAARGLQFTTSSDTETLILAWRVWGERMVERLRGQFAFAIYDSKQDILFLARDRMGEKPLHYALLNDGTFAFASEIKGLSPIPGLDLRLDLQALEDFFALGYVPEPKSIYASIRKLPPAHSMTVGRGRHVRLRQYWNVLSDEPHGSEHGEASEAELLSRLERAVRYQLVSDVEVGAFLSGGLDSSSVVSIMTKLSKSPPRTFTIGSNAKDYDESSFAKSVADACGTRHHMRQVDAAMLLEVLPKLPSMYDEPFGDISAIPTYIVSRESSRSLKVCLTGDGGDETLAGYRRYQFHLAEEAWRAAVPRRLRESLLKPAAFLYPKLDWAPRPLRAKTTLQELSAEPAVAFYWMVTAVSDEMRRNLYSGDLQAELHGYEASDLIRARFAEASDFSPLQQAQYADLMTYLPGDILTKVDRASMANSLEVRPPFLDHEFVSWAFRLPTRAKIGRNGGKHILKRAMAPHLPINLLNRPKQGFTVPIADWLRTELRGQALDLGLHSKLVETGFFDGRTINRWVSQHLSGRRDHSRELWQLMVFDAFLTQKPCPIERSVRRQSVVAATEPVAPAL
jgi:asparagine synthase (glutamine-hydrolysing)